MTDIRIVPISQPEAITLDWLLTPAGSLDTDQELATAVIVALGTDRLADASDALPDPDSTDRRGWWGDLDAGLLWDGWPIGCRLWLLAREKITGAAARQGSTLARAEAYAREALQPFVDRKIASRVTVVATRTRDERIDITATLFRGSLPAVQLRFADLWDGIGA
jgi:phage gp46-like protein